MSSENQLLYTAIEIALSEADRPLTSREVAEHPDVKGLGLGTDRVSIALANMYYDDASTVHRIPHRATGLGGGRGTPRWEYYDARYLTPDGKKVNTRLLPAESDTDPASIALLENATAKAVSLTVAGVTIRVELAH